MRIAKTLVPSTAAAAQMSHLSFQSRLVLPHEEFVHSPRIANLLGNEMIVVSEGWPKPKNKGRTADSMLKTNDVRYADIPQAAIEALKRAVIPQVPHVRSQIPSSEILFRITNRRLRQSMIGIGRATEQSPWALVEQTPWA